ncbi:MAG: hypothetical protein ACPGQD_04510 [Planctomycetota bacterium]
MSGELLDLDHFRHRRALNPRRRPKPEGRAPQATIALKGVDPNEILAAVTLVRMRDGSVRWVGLGLPDDDIARCEATIVIASRVLHETQTTLDRLTAGD